MSIRRRALLACPVALMASPGLASRSNLRNIAILDAQTTWNDPPPPPQLTESWIDVDGATLWCVDSGGSGTPVVLMHAMTGSAASWIYQQSDFVSAGFRVVAYSRRGHFRSSPANAGNPGNATRDLHAVVSALKLPPFHLVGCAAGAFVLPDYALSYPDTLRSLTISSSLAGIKDATFGVIAARLRPPGFAELPPEFKELGPSYRAGNPAGVEAWRTIQQAARNSQIVEQETNHSIDWSNIAEISVPVLLITGDADLYMPPSLLRTVASRFVQSSVAIIAEAGHSPQWEQPLAFNQAVVDFFRSIDR